MKTEIIRDVLIVAGAVASVIGLGLAWLPLGLIAVGVVLVGLAVLWQIDVDQRKARAERDRRIPH